MNKFVLCCSPEDAELYEQKNTDANYFFVFYGTCIGLKRICFTFQENIFKMPFKIYEHVSFLGQQIRTIGTKCLFPYPLMIQVEFGWNQPRSFRLDSVWNFEFMRHGRRNLNKFEKILCSLCFIPSFTVPGWLVPEKKSFNRFLLYMGMLATLINGLKSFDLHSFHHGLHTNDHLQICVNPVLMSLCKC